ncbi:MAG: dicarboxylate/amino acid:cation symporter [Spirochaetia bacterium]|nr:dicarboxylate/amino acid:cation symporter [Spirochaetia bacterium]
MASIFKISVEEIEKQSEELKKQLLATKANSKEVTSSLLLLEEIIVRLQGNSGHPTDVQIQKHLGNVSLSLSSHGEEYNPLASLSSWDIESDEYCRDQILRAYQANLSYCRRNGNNIVTITVHENENRKVIITFVCMLAGIVMGLVLKWIPQAAADFISNSIFSTAQTLFLNAMSLLLAPVVFFSITTSLANLSGSKEAGRIGGKVISSYLVTTVIAVLIGFGMGFLFFMGDVPKLPASLTNASTVAENIEVTVSSLLIGIIPKNIIQPILERNMLQVIFVAVFCGLALSILGDKTDRIRNIIREANTLFLKMMEMVISFIPLAAFASMALLVYSCEASTLFMLITFLLSIAAGSIILILVYMFMIVAIGHISPIPYVRKAPMYLLTPFTLASSSVCIPLTIDFCQKRLGVSEKISSFGIPLGATINMNGCALSVTISVVMLAKMCGIELAPADWIQIGIMTMLLSAGAPGVPNTGLVIIATLLSSTPIPASTLGFLIGIWNIVDRIDTASNVNGDIVTSMVVAASENELDSEVYKR